MGSPHRQDRLHETSENIAANSSRVPAPSSTAAAAPPPLAHAHKCPPHLPSPLQPSTEIFESFDQLLLMQLGGRLTYFGPLGFESRQLIAYLEGQPGVTPIRPGYNPATWWGCRRPGCYPCSHIQQRAALFSARMPSPALHAHNQTHIARQRPSRLSPLACLTRTACTRAPQDAGGDRGQHGHHLRSLASRLPADLCGGLAGWLAGCRCRRRVPLLALLQLRVSRAVGLRCQHVSTRHRQKSTGKRASDLAAAGPPRSGASAALWRETPPAHSRLPAGC